MTMERTITPPRKGLMHLFDAARYSLDGFVRLMGETAARHEIAGGVIAAGVLAFSQATPGQWIAAGVLFAVLLATEALNTAIEVLTDHVSPGWSAEAKHAKDLGSLAVGLMVVAFIGYVGSVATGLI